MLWPLGGVAYVDAPQRPAAQLWSLAAGPLVNVALLPVLGGVYFAASASGWSTRTPTCTTWRTACWPSTWCCWSSNLLPIYPLDGGQILRSLPVVYGGQGQISLAAATVIGFIGAAGLVGLAIVSHSTWTLLIAGFVVMNCWVVCSMPAS